jgi:hypothetical protein
MMRTKPLEIRGEALYCNRTATGALRDGSPT